MPKESWGRGGKPSSYTFFSGSCVNDDSEGADRVIRGALRTNFAKDETNGLIGGDCGTRFEKMLPAPPLASVLCCLSPGLGVR